MSQNYVLSYTDEYLAHHGILGQKWGKKNGPPYPLDSNQMSKAEKRESSGNRSNNPNKKNKNDRTLTRGQNIVENLGIMSASVIGTAFLTSVGRKYMEQMSGVLARELSEFTTKTVSKAVKNGGIKKISKEMGNIYMRRKYIDL